MAVAGAAEGRVPQWRRPQAGPQLREPMVFDRDPQMPSGSRWRPIGGRGILRKRCRLPGPPVVSSGRRPVDGALFGEEIIMFDRRCVVAPSRQWATARIALAAVAKAFNGRFVIVAAVDYQRRASTMQ